MDPLALEGEDVTEAVRAGRRAVESCQRPTDRPRRQRCSVAAAPPLLGLAVRIGRGERSFAWDCTHWGDVADSQCEFWDEEARIVAILKAPGAILASSACMQRPGRQAKASNGLLSLL